MDRLRPAGAPRHHIAVIDGPNMSNLGARDRRVYGGIGSITELQEYVTAVGRWLGVEVETFVSTYEGAILEFVHGSAERTDGYLINPAGLTVVGEATRHALEETGRPVVEVHLANVSAPPTTPRGLPGGPWESRFTRTATGLAMGLHQYSYVGALVGLVLALDDPSFLGASGATGSGGDATLSPRVVPQSDRSPSP